MKKVRKAVIPVAGLGSRFLPGSKVIPKEMFPVIDKPVIQHIVEEFIASGIEEFLFITGPYKKAIEDHFDKFYELEHRLEERGKQDQLKILKETSSLAKFYYIRQGEPLGTGHAVSLAKSFVGEEYFALAYGDDLYDNREGIPALKELIDMHEKTGGSIIGCKEVPQESTNRYGIIKLEEGNKIETIVEKPKVEEAPSNLAGLGRYVVSSKIFDILEKIPRDKSGEYQFTDGMKELMKDEDFYACKITNKYCDMGNKTEFVKTIIDFALDREDMGKEIRKYIQEKSSK